MNPLPPYDASPFALFQAFRLHQGGHLGRLRALAEFFGTQQANPFQLIPSHPAQIAKWALGRMAAAEELLTRHTLIALYSVGESEEQFHATLDRIVLTGPGRTRAVLKGRTEQLSLEETPPLRSCRSCIQDDLSYYGFAFWRSTHQWPAIKHCLVHDEPLQISCDSCGHVQQPPHLEIRPESPCPLCNSTKKRALRFVRTKGYNQFLLEVEKVRADVGRYTSDGRSLFGEEPNCGNWLTPSKRNYEAEAFKTYLLDLWNCSTPAQLCKQLVCPVDAGLEMHGYYRRNLAAGHWAAQAPPALVIAAAAALARW
jgi:hypothetical protein